MDEYKKYIILHDGLGVFTYTVIGWLGDFMSRGYRQIVGTADTLDEATAQVRCLQLVYVPIVRAFMCESIAA